MGKSKIMDIRLGGVEIQSCVLVVGLMYTLLQTRLEADKAGGKSNFMDTRLGGVATGKQMDFGLGDKNISNV